jgi:hypothetical protein
MSLTFASEYKEIMSTDSARSYIPVLELYKIIWEFKQLVKELV